METDEFYLQSIAEIKRTFFKHVRIPESAVNEAIENTAKIADSVENYELPHWPSMDMIPVFDYPKEFASSNDFFYHLIKKGWDDKKIGDLS